MPSTFEQKSLVYVLPRNMKLVTILWKIALHTPRHFAFIDISSTKEIFQKTWKLFLNASHELNEISASSVT